MPWFVLTVAGFFETGWAIGLKYCDGFTRLWPSLWTIGAMTVSVLLLSWSVRTLPIGTAYAVWTGIGTAGAAILGMLLFQEPPTAIRLLCIALIMAGIVGLRLSSSH